MINGLIVEGLFLYGRAKTGEPGRDVSFMLVNSEAGEPSQAIDRVDWNPLTGHGNRNIGPEELRLITISGSHRHHLHNNLTNDGKIRTGNLPVAAPVTPNPGNFAALVDFVAKSYNIAGLDYLGPPMWVEDLFG